MLELEDAHRLIQESEQPKRNPAAGADFGVVHREVAVRKFCLFHGNDRFVYMAKSDFIIQTIRILKILWLQPKLVHLHYARLFWV